jgi:hypothetical protein
MRVETHASWTRLANALDIDARWMLRRDLLIIPPLEPRPASRYKLWIAVDIVTKEIWEGRLGVCRADPKSKNIDGTKGNFSRV